MDVVILIVSVKFRLEFVINFLLARARASRQASVVFVPRIYISMLLYEVVELLHYSITKIMLEYVLHNITIIYDEIQNIIFEILALLERFV